MEMYGFKGLTCQGVQYEIGKPYLHDLAERLAENLDSKIREIVAKNSRTNTDIN